MELKQIIIGGYQKENILNWETYETFMIFQFLILFLD